MVTNLAVGKILLIAGYFNANPSKTCEYNQKIYYMRLTLYINSHYQVKASTWLVSTPLVNSTFKHRNESKKALQSLVDSQRKSKDDQPDIMGLVSVHSVTSTQYITANINTICVYGKSALDTQVNLARRLGSQCHTLLIYCRGLNHHPWGLVSAPSTCLHP